MAMNFKLPDDVNARLMAFMGKEKISVMDKNAVISRAVDMYLAFLAEKDTGLSGILEERRAARIAKGKQSRHPNACKQEP